MPDYLPDLVAPKEVEEEVKDVEEEEVEEEEQEEEVEEELQPVVEPREKLSQDEVFTTPQVKPVQPLDDVPNPAKVKKAKRPLSDKQKAHLERIREKGQLAMKAKREENKKLKEQGLAPKQTKKKIKELAETKAAVDRLVVKEKEKMSEEDIERISEKAIANYELKRKARKEEKKKTQSEELHKDKIKTQISRAMGKPDPDDIWAHALGGMM